MKKYLLYLVNLAALAAAGWAIWYFRVPPPAPIGQHEPAKVAPQIKAIPKTDIRPPKVMVYAQKAKGKLKLPEPMQADPNVHVLEATRVKADDHPHTVTTVINSETGEIQTLDRRDPLPLFAFKKSGALGLEHDFILRTSTLYARQDFLSIKSINVGGRLSLDSDRQLAAKVSVEWRW